MSFSVPPSDVRAWRISNATEGVNILSTHTFSALGVSIDVADALSARSIVTPFAIQAAVLPDALAGVDILARSPTGSGKTLAYAIPLVERTSRNDRRPAALVLVPTRELARQVADELAAVGAPKRLAVASVYGGVPLSAQAKRARAAHVVVATPGRLYDLLERKLLDVGGVRILVLDEADRMLDMGFRPQVDRIVKSVPRNRQTMFFSATLDDEVSALARLYTNAPSRFQTESPSAPEQGRSRTASSPWATTRSSRHSSSTSRRHMVGRSSSSGRSAVPTRSPASSPGTE